jgi:hypothetical protein
MLIVFNRKEKSLYRKCDGCTCFVELKDDEKKYPKTVGVICNAQQIFMSQCFKYDWYRAVSHYHGERTADKPIPQPLERTVTEDMHSALSRLRRIGK